MSKVSVIIPVYNVEQYIERCVRSLFEQTLIDMEYIFVDDCSSDNSINILGSVLEEYPNRKSQVKIIRHLENKGLPIARKTGIDNSTGDYIIQCDSDDWVDKDMYKAMYNMAVNTHSDVVVCGYYVSDGVSNVPYIGSKYTDKNSYIRDCLLQKESASLCSKLFKRELFNNNIMYPKYAMGEDIALCLQLIYYSSKLCFISKAYYYYYSNLNSISKKQSDDSVISRFNQIYYNILLLERFFKQKNVDKSINNAVDCFKHLQRNLLAPILTQKKYYKVWRTCFGDINKKVLFMPLNLKNKFIFILRFTRLIKK